MEMYLLAKSTINFSSGDLIARSTFIVPAVILLALKLSILALVIAASAIFAVVIVASAIKAVLI